MLGGLVGGQSDASLDAVFVAQRVVVVGAPVGALTGTSLVAFPWGAHPRGCTVAVDMDAYPRTRAGAEAAMQGGNHAKSGKLSVLFFRGQLLC